jgi:excisionase family DNA binding protein
METTYILDYGLEGRVKSMVTYNEQDRMLRVADVAEILHTHPNTIRRWTLQGKIGACRIGPRGDRRFWQSDIYKLLNDFNLEKHNEHLFNRNL